MLLRISSLETLLYPTSVIPPGVWAWLSPNCSHQIISTHYNLPRRRGFQISAPSPSYLSRQPSQSPIDSKPPINIVPKLSALSTASSHGNIPRRSRFRRHLHRTLLNPPRNPPSIPSQQRIQLKNHLIAMLVRFLRTRPIHHRIPPTPQRIESQQLRSNPAHQESLFRWGRVELDSTRGGIATYAPAVGYLVDHVQRHDFRRRFVPEGRVFPPRFAAGEVLVHDAPMGRMARVERSEFHYRSVIVRVDHAEDGGHAHVRHGYFLLDSTPE
mmetsp:Transcript_38124/g.79915  ORF Transcript_38124/g.79915 Transcript_38124/m.79915 type:complete len:270 (+) Transcript_38124:163-972(+)